MNCLEHTRKATLLDLPEVLSLYKKATRYMNDSGINQWDDIYPDELTLRNDIKDDSMYLHMINNKIVSIFVLNQSSNPEYEEGSWKYNTLSFAVIHRLCVNPVFQHQGIGTRTMIAAESIIKDMKIGSVRLDAFSQNPSALRLYEKLGYSKVGAVTFRKGEFFLFEKKL